MTASSLAAGDVLPLPLNTPQRFYRGGERILRFRGLEQPSGFDGRRPEDWLASTTRLFAEGGEGLTVLPDGWLLAAAVEQHPEAWFGSDHLGCPHGKTEAWLVLEAEPHAMVWLGLRENMSAERLAELVRAQDERLLASLNPLPVTRGDAVLVPAGQPHAIGAGVMVVELQEPTDFSVMLENQRFGLDTEHAWLGLGQERALESVATQALTPERLDALRRRWDGGDGIRPALCPEADAFFTAECIDTRHGTVTVGAGFSVLVVVGGAGTLRTAAGQTQEIRTGQTLLTPFAAGPLEVEGQVTVLRCSPARTAGTVDPLARSDATRPQEAP
jgi:mannose-6-phosphate isomerase